MTHLKVKKGDTVVMLSGKDRTKRGKITSVSATAGKVVVEGLNMIKRHLKARRQGQKGQVISRERAVAVASVALICSACGKPTRVGYKVMESGAKVRICRKCQAEQ